MSKIIKPFRKLHPIDKEILRAISSTKMKVTPSQVAKQIGVHPVTTQRRMALMGKEKIIQPMPKGNRNYYKSDIDLIRKFLRARKPKF
ncbi:hypothetical protein HYW74_02035 [Candidatus Pacearchaeota archaeon]|nr:hypothetical protein [Candidatus Pacearchaeota archaeon]